VLFARLVGDVFVRERLNQANATAAETTFPRRRYAATKPKAASPLSIIVQLAGNGAGAGEMKFDTVEKFPLASNIWIGDGSVKLGVFT
jgi:hypothetical protein